MIGLAAGRPAATYSIGFEAEGYDEMAFARIASRRFGTEHHEWLQARPAPPLDR